MAFNMEIIEDTTNFIASRLAFIIYQRRDTAQQGQQFRNGMRQKFDGQAETDRMGTSGCRMRHFMHEGIELRDEDLSHDFFFCVLETVFTQKLLVDFYK